jgi:exonuclease SbcD
MTIDDTLRHITEDASSFIEDAAASLDPSIPSILAAHVGLATSLVTISSEQTMTLGLHPLFAPSQLHPELFDYVALGHIHQHQWLDGPTPIVYAGSLQPIDFGEEGDAKGFYIIKLDPAAPHGSRFSSDPIFNYVTARRFVTVSASPSNPNPTPEVIAAIEAADVAGSIVRLDIKLSQAQAPLLNTSALTQALAPAHSVAYIRRQVDDNRHTPRLPDTLHPESLPPLDALLLYLKQQQVAPAHRELLLANARTLMERIG